MMRALVMGGLLVASVANAAAAPRRPDSVGKTTVAAAKVMPAGVRAAARTRESSDIFGLAILPMIAIAATVLATVIVVGSEGEANSP